MVNRRPAYESAIKDDSPPKRRRREVIVDWEAFRARGRELEAEAERYIATPEGKAEFERLEALRKRGKKR